MPKEPAPTRIASPRIRRLLLCAIPFFLALALALGINSKSLWYDEIFSLANFTSQPIHEIVSGRYSPNNHILSSLLDKTSITLAALIGIDPVEPDPVDNPAAILPHASTVPLRLPSMLAGAAAAVALAFPLLRGKMPPRHDLFPFFLLALFCACQPWLLSFSTEARGYSLLLLFSLLATNRLSDFSGRFNWLYPLWLLAAIYTIPIALLLVPAHGLTLLVLGRPALRRWMLAAALALVAAAALYLPFYSGIHSYGSGLARPHGFSYSAYLASVGRTLLTGWNSSSPLILFTLLILPAGLVLFFKNPTLTPLRPTLLTFSFASMFTLLIAGFLPSYAGARFALWLIPVFLLAILAVLLSIRAKSLRACLLLSALPLAFFLAHAYALGEIPPQPLLDSVILADTRVPPGTAIVGVYLGAFETFTYYQATLHRHSAVVYSLSDLHTARANAARSPWLLLFDEPDLATADPAFLDYLRAHYSPAAFLPGRISGVTLLKPNP